MVYHHMGLLYQQQSKTAEAVHFFKKSLQIAGEIGQAAYVSDNHEALFKCYASSGDYNNFSKHYKMFKIGNDTLLENLQQAQMAEMEARFKVNQVVQENIALTEENKVMYNNTRKYRLLTFSFGGIIVFSLLFYFLYIIFKR